MPSGPLIAGRFSCTHLLKCGRGVSTYTAVDLEEGAEVVVKTVAVSEVSPAVRLRVAHEGTILRRLETSSFRPLVTLGRDGDLFYLVQPAAGGGWPVADRLRAARRDRRAADAAARS